MTECTACEKGLVFVAEVIFSENEAKIKKLCLCDSCRKILNKIIKELKVETK